MRVLLLLGLLIALILPERLAWRPSAGECCEEACTCASSSEPACCAAREPEVVLVAACGCGRSHDPRVVERQHVEWDLPAPAPRLPGPAPRRWTPPIKARPEGQAPAPEPPPPRLLV